jgi:hypothetical protein
MSHSYRSDSVTETLLAVGGSFDDVADGTGRGTPLVSVVNALTDRPDRGGGNSGIVQTLGANQTPALMQGMAVRRLTPRECSRLQGFPDDYLELLYADADEAHAAQILHHLWREVGAKVFAKQEWRTGIAAALLTPEVLLAGVFIGWLSWTVARECLATSGAVACSPDIQARILRQVRWHEESGHAPYQRESFGQLACELGVSLSELPHEASQARAHLRRHRLWPEAQRTWPLRYAFATEKQRTSGRALNPDGPRYKALGNSMACNVMRWIGRRIAAVEALHPAGEPRMNAVPVSGGARE